MDPLFKIIEVMLGLLVLVEFDKNAADWLFDNNENIKAIRTMFNINSYYIVIRLYSG